MASLLVFAVSWFHLMAAWAKSFPDIVLNLENSG
jgi:hypothetical protein